MSIYQPHSSTNGDVEAPRAGVVVAYPEDTDILCGKDKKSLSFPGSIHYKQVVDEYMRQYSGAKGRSAKMAITKRIMDQLHSEGRRFLKLNAAAGQYETCSRTAIRDKIGHAIRVAGKGLNKESKSKSSRKKIVAAAASLVTTSRPVSLAESLVRQVSCLSLTSQNSRSSSLPSLTSQSSNSSTSSSRGSSSSSSSSSQSMEPLPECPIFASQLLELLVPREIAFPNEQSTDETDLNWMMQIPVMEGNPLDTNIYLIQG